jgi:hypothetical protein
MDGTGVTKLHRASQRVKQIHAEDGITFASDVNWSEGRWTLPSET